MQAEQQPERWAADWNIDWQAPWLAQLQVLGQSAHEHVQGGATVAQALQKVALEQGLLPGWQFVDQQLLPAGWPTRLLSMTGAAFPHATICTISSMA